MARSSPRQFGTCLGAAASLLQHGTNAVEATVGSWQATKKTWGQKKTKMADLTLRAS
jgi:hypothetical protein